VGGFPASAHTLGGFLRLGSGTFFDRSQESAVASKDPGSPLRRVRQEVALERLKQGKIE